MRPKNHLHDLTGCSECARSQPGAPPSGTALNTLHCACIFAQERAQQVRAPTPRAPTPLSRGVARGNNPPSTTRVPTTEARMWLPRTKVPTPALYSWVRPRRSPGTTYSTVAAGSALACVWGWGGREHSHTAALKRHITPPRPPDPSGDCPVQHRTMYSVHDITAKQSKGGGQRNRRVS
jgi:hypothetical protein